MNGSTARNTLLAVSLCLFVTSPQVGAQEDGFKPIFNGKTLEGWQAREEGFWTVENGAITGQTTEAHCFPSQLMTVFATGSDLGNWPEKRSSMEVSLP